MKIYKILFLALLSQSCEKHIESSDVPEPAKTAFHKKYPQAQEVEWENKHDKYEAKFKLEGKKVEAEFSADGVLLEEEEK
jgi:hypothetical protein